MDYISNIRLSVPKAAPGEIIRQKLLNDALSGHKRLTYIQAGAGYGKTALLAQIANTNENTVWLTLDGESDVFTFANNLCAAVRLRFPACDFTISEFIPFESRNNFITILADALISALEKLADDLMIILDDFHTVTDQQINQLVACIVKYKPDNIQLYLSSRESPWPELVPQRVRGNILELTQKELKFSRDEAIQVLGLDDEYVYRITEGWPLAIGSYKVLLESGVSLANLPKQGKEALYSYLFYECVSRLPAEVVDFLKSTAIFEELDARMLDAILNKKNSKLILENLASRNIFTLKNDSDHYRYHALFREYLLEGLDYTRRSLLLNKAALFYYDQQQYSKAANMAIFAKNTDILQRVVLNSYKNYVGKGKYSELLAWFNALDHLTAVLSPAVLVAKGALFSSIGKFNEAKKCLDKALPLLSENCQALYIEAIIHKARVLRNYISFEESNKLLDDLIPGPDKLAPDTLYTVVIEKVYNFCWNSQIGEAYTLIHQMIERCARAGEVRIKAWLERYLTAVHFFAGRMKDAVDCYEKSLQLPENERQYLDMHSIGMYAAKAYQMLGNQNKAVSLISAELQKLRSTGKYEEMWAAYLLAAEIHYHIAFVDRRNGGNQTYETAMKYFTLADEYAPLYRRTEFQMRWAKMHRLACSLLLENGNQGSIIDEIIVNLDGIPHYPKTIILGRLFSYYVSLSDFPNAVKYARLAIAFGEESGLMLIPTTAYGILAKAAITIGDQDQAVQLTSRYLQLCSENGVYDYFRMHKEYGPILEFALSNGTEPDFAKQMLVLAGYNTKKVYIKTLGGFAIFPFNNRQEPLKMRTKKERELLAFLLDAGNEGATKEQIYNAIWSESESEDVKKLIGVNLAHIKKDLASFGVENPIINHEKHYSIRRDKIECDIELFEAAVEEFRHKNSNEAAQKIISLYKGEYLSDFEALWATNKRIRYKEAYEAALNYLNSNY
jgi:LuxR family maltose regulon positive regulatory protein